MAANTVSHALAEIAWLIPDTCSRRAERTTSSGSVSGRMRLAAEPARKVRELVALRAVRDEIDAGRRVGIDGHAAHVDAFLGPQFAEQAAEGIATQARDIA